MKKSKISKLNGCTIKAVTTKAGSYGLLGEIRLETTEGLVYIIDNLGEDGGECGIYPCLNVYEYTKEDLKKYSL